MPLCQLLDQGEYHQDAYMIGTSRAIPKIIQGELFIIQGRTLTATKSRHISLNKAEVNIIISKSFVLNIIF